MFCSEEEKNIFEKEAKIRKLCSFKIIAVLLLEVTASLA